MEPEFAIAEGPPPPISLREFSAAHAAIATKTRAIRSANIAGMAAILQGNPAAAPSLTQSATAGAQRRVAAAAGALGLAASGVAPAQAKQIQSEATKALLAEADQLLVKAREQGRDAADAPTARAMEAAVLELRGRVEWSLHRYLQAATSFEAAAAIHCAIEKYQSATLVAGTAPDAATATKAQRHTVNGGIGGPPPAHDAVNRAVWCALQACACVAASVPVQERFLAHEPDAFDHLADDHHRQDDHASAASAVDGNNSFTGHSAAAILRGMGGAMGGAQNSNEPSPTSVRMQQFKTDALGKLRAMATRVTNNNNNSNAAQTGGGVGSGGVLLENGSFSSPPPPVAALPPSSSEGATATGPQAATPAEAAAATPNPAARLFAAFSNRKRSNSKQDIAASAALKNAIPASATTATASAPESGTAEPGVSSAAPATASAPAAAPGSDGAVAASVAPPPPRSTSPTLMQRFGRFKDKIKAMQILPPTLPDGVPPVGSAAAAAGGGTAASGALGPPSSAGAISSVPSSGGDVAATAASVVPQLMEESAATTDAGPIALTATPEDASEPAQTVAADAIVDAPPDVPVSATVEVSDEGPETTAASVHVDPTEATATAERPGDVLDGGAAVDGNSAVAADAPSVSPSKTANFPEKPEVGTTLKPLSEATNPPVRQRQEIVCAASSVGVRPYLIAHTRDMPHFLSANSASQRIASILIALSREVLDCTSSAGPAVVAASLSADIAQLAAQFCVQYDLDAGVTALTSAHTSSVVPASLKVAPAAAGSAVIATRGVCLLEMTGGAGGRPPGATPTGPAPGSANNNDDAPAAPQTTAALLPISAMGYAETMHRNASSCDDAAVNAGSTPPTVVTDASDATRATVQPYTHVLGVLRPLRPSMAMPFSEAALHAAACRLLRNELEGAHMLATWALSALYPPVAPSVVPPALVGKEEAASVPEQILERPPIVKTFSNTGSRATGAPGAAKFSHGLANRNAFLTTMRATAAAHREHHAQMRHFLGQIDDGKIAPTGMSMHGPMQAPYDTRSFSRKPTEAALLGLAALLAVALRRPVQLHKTLHPWAVWWAGNFNVCASPTCGSLSSSRTSSVSWEARVACGLQAICVGTWAALGVPGSVLHPSLAATQAEQSDPTSSSAVVAQFVTAATTSHPRVAALVAAGAGKTTVGAAAPVIYAGMTMIRDAVYPHHPLLAAAVQQVFACFCAPRGEELLGLLPDLDDVAADAAARGASAPAEMAAAGLMMIKGAGLHNSFTDVGATNRSFTSGVGGVRSTSPKIGRYTASGNGASPTPQQLPN